MVPPLTRTWQKCWSTQPSWRSRASSLRFFYIVDFMIVDLGVITEVAGCDPSAHPNGFSLCSGADPGYASRQAGANDGWPGTNLTDTMVSQIAERIVMHPNKPTSSKRKVSEMLTVSRNLSFTSASCPRE